MMKVRTVWAIIVILVVTPVLALLCVLVWFFDRSHRWVGFISKHWARLILRATGLPVTIDGLEHLEPGKSYIYIGNHCSALDIPLALGYLPRTIAFMAKKELFRIPIFGWSLYAMGSIPVNRSNRSEAIRSVDRALAALRTKPLSMIFYPEGTRSRTGEMIQFKRGVFHLALRSGLPLVPIAVKGTFQAMPPDGLSLTYAPIYVTIGQPIETADLTVDDREPLRQQSQNRIQAMLDASGPVSPSD